MATATAVAPKTEREFLLQNRWLILFFSVLSMVAVANLQYGWTFFVPSIVKQLSSTTALVQVTFTLFVLLETWLVPFEGYLVDRFGPRNLVLLGGVFAAAGWVGSGLAGDLTTLYLTYAVAAIGAGIVYGTAIGTALKWFPDHRGLAAGLTAAGFGAGSALTVAPIADMIASSGYQPTFIQWGLIQGVVVIFAALFLKAPPAGFRPRALPEFSSASRVVLSDASWVASSLDLGVPAFGFGAVGDAGDVGDAGEVVGLGVGLAALTATDPLAKTPAASAPMAPDPAKMAPATASFIRLMFTS